MTKTRTVPLFLTALVAFFSAIAALAVSNGQAAHANGNRGHEDGIAITIGHGHSPLVTEKAVALREEMRKLWEDHITWTRLAIVSFAAGSPELPATEARLLRNQSDIAAAIRPYYGRAASHRLRTLLREHITGAVARPLVAVLLDLRVGEGGIDAPVQ